MNVNATLIVQAVNFFIAYFLFRFILLKPAYAAICKENGAQSSLEQLVEDDRRLVFERRQKISDQWQSSMFFFQKYAPMPVSTVALFKGTVPRVKLKPIESDVLDKTKNRVAEAIVIAIGKYNEHC